MHARDSAAYQMVAPLHPHESWRSTSSGGYSLNLLVSQLRGYKHRLMVIPEGQDAPARELALLSEGGAIDVFHLRLWHG